jgi:hypothetical protein
MSRLVRTFLMIVACSLLAVAVRAQSAPDTIEVVVLNGPHAGTYKTPSSETICAHYKQMKWTFATWRGNEAPEPKKLSAAAIKVSNPEQAGPKRGEVQIAFGTEPGKKVVADYNVTDVPITVMTKGKGVEMSFDGKTKEGVGLRVNAKCSEVENLP